MAYQLSETPGAVDYHFIKAADFRVVHADGVWGGATPSRNIAIVFFSERLPLPTTVQHQINEGGVIGDEVDRQSKTGIVREVEVEVIMNKATAIGIRGWLKRYIEELS